MLVGMVGLILVRKDDVRSWSRNVNLVNRIKVARFNFDVPSSSMSNPQK